jgi:Transcriptional activator of glycolytic enzymes
MQIPIDLQGLQQQITSMRNAIDTLVVRQEATMSKILQRVSQPYEQPYVPRTLTSSLHDSPAIQPLLVGSLAILPESNVSLPSSSNALEGGKKRKTIKCFPSGDPSHPMSMERELTTTLDVWQEYSQGLNGKMSIIERDETMSKWRQQAKVARQFYFVRKEICSVVKEVASILNISKENAAVLVNNKQKEEGWTLTSLHKWIARIKVESKSTSQNFIDLLIADMKEVSIC